jgi:hypothetical protein
MPLLLLSSSSASSFQDLSFPSIFFSLLSCSVLVDGLKSAGPQFNFLPDAEPKDYFSLFFTDELWNNFSIETNRCVRDKIAELQLSLSSVWNRLLDVSVLKMKVF